MLNNLTNNKMGRYYNGDVDGKFMFAVQSSDAHTRFGAEEVEPSYIDYQISRDSYDDIVKELDSIDKGSIERVNKMFEENNGYNDEIQKQYNVTKEDLSEYADYRLGKQVKDFFDDNPEDDYCNFTAEL
tara:strand:+ start:282 stop:668 length:387 start_codon:yes stop_codon:yes gene_type:complete